MPGSVNNGTFTEFINVTKASINRYREGQATGDDMAQIGYAARHGKQHLANSGMQHCYPRVYAEYERIINEAEAIAEA